MNPNKTPILLTTIIALACGGAVAWLNLAPQVDPDFFFANNDPQIQETNEIERDFPSSAQIVVRVQAPDIQTESYRSSLSALSNDLRKVAGVNSVRSILTTPNYEDPLWRPLLLSPSGDASYILLDVTPSDPSRLVDQLHEAVGPYAGPNLQIRVSGVPYILELIRRSLMRDLAIFSLASMAVFGLAVALVYRRLWIAVGTLTTASAAAVATLTVLQLTGVTIGLLTANLVTIVFVLTLSHMVFLTSNWRQETTTPAEGGTPVQNRTPAQCVRAAVHRTLYPSFWCMATTTLGFISLLVASAKPLRQLGVAGAVGTVMAIIVAYAIYPAYLRATATHSAKATRQRNWLPTRHRVAWLGGFGVATVIAATGMVRLSTDPSLLSYFAPGSEIREGLELIDRDGGSSPLLLVVEQNQRGRFDDSTGVARLRRLHDQLREDPDVGSVVSPTLLFAEIERSPFAEGRTLREILDIPLVAPIVAPFLSADRTRAHFTLRMRESGRVGSRHDAINRIEDSVRSLDANPVLTGGLYDLQAKLADLLASSLRTTLVGLLILFGLIGWILTRSVRTSLVLVMCLSAVPIAILGAFGFAEVAIDIISSPSSNVALGMGVDSMIHLVVRARLLTNAGVASPWREARDQLRLPIAGATLIIGAGFGIFGLSAFPPTARFGLAVILGTVTAASMALIAMPMIKQKKQRR